jgi:hypothetical protein
MMRQFANTIFRTNPSYELVLIDRLAQEDRDLIDTGEDLDDLYGVLRPCRGSPLKVRSASRETALLLLTLRDPGPIPAYLKKDLGADYRSVVARLVLDEILEVEEAGSFVSGTAARNLVLAEAPNQEGGRLAELSIEALKYGQALEGLTTQELARRLYFYGREPVSSLERRGLASEESIREYLGQIGDGAAPSRLNANWIEAPKQEDRPWWRMWHPRHSALGLKAAGYKLYISADYASLPAVFLAFAEALAEGPGVRGFKVARDVSSLCRPDNVIAYFSRLEDLSSGAARIKDYLSGCKARGVPFTAEVTRDGLMSWGIDPPECHSPHASSWRLWVVDRLAEYLLAAKTAGDAEPWRFALDRLSIDGVETGTWVPTNRNGARLMTTG